VRGIPIKELFMKRLFLVCLAAVALALPSSALADSGKPGNGQGGFKEIAQQLKDAAGSCKKASTSERKACRARLLALLVAARARNEVAKDKIHARCDEAAATPPTAADPSSGARPARNPCSRAAQLLERLDRAEAKIDKLIAKLRKGGPKNSGASSGSATGSDPQVAEIESELASLPTP
jgi:hypothetical protein